MDSSQFSDSQPKYDAIEQMDTRGATCDTFRVKLYGKLHFLKRLKAEYAGDIRYQEALRKEFETGYRLEHPNLVRYLSFDPDGILMEYVDGETLSQRLATNPEYFKNRKHIDKFVRQLLDALGYLHSHQVLHLDLKPDNILLTRINDDVKLIDLGCCYTDSFPDTQGYTSEYAALEQLAGETVDVRTDIYTFGKILAHLPAPYIYNKVIARCTAERPEDRYQSVGEILHDINHKRRFSRYLAVFVAIVAALAVCLVLLTHQPKDSPAKQQAPMDSIALPKAKAVPAEEPTPQFPEKDDRTRFTEDVERMMDKAYRSTIATFCDSVFPPPTPSTGKAWADSSTEFHNQTAQIADRLAKKYPSIPETAIRQETEMRFQSFVSHVFNQMRENAKQ